MDFPKTLSKFYWSIIKKFPAFFVGLFIISVCVQIVNYSIFPFMNKWMFQIFENAFLYDFSDVMQLIMLMVMIYVIDMTLAISESIIKGRRQPIITRDAGIQLYKRVYSNDVDFFINRPAGQISNKVNEVQKNLFPTTLNFWSKIVGVALSFMLLASVLFKMNIWMAMIVILTGVIRTIWQMYRQRKINKVGKELLDISSNISGTRTDSLGNVITAKLFANTNYENDYIWKKQNKEIDLRKQNSFLERIQWIPVDTTWIVVRLALLGFCWFLIKAGQIGISDAAFIVAAFGNINGMFMRVNEVVKDYSENKEKAKHAYADIIQEQKITDKPNAKNLKITRAEINFDNVSFDYGAADVVKNFNLHVGHAEKIGVVGLSGAGKTTLVNLILRLYDVKSGAIKIDGADVRDVKQDSLRRQISFVPQESVLFNRTLLENIRYAKPSATRAQVIAAAKKANIHEFIDGLPEKYDTLVGNRGIKLSGGQRQRVAIARAILKESPILILDEATSALDSKNEILIQGALAKVMKGKTTFAIAHRLSTLRNMDRIIVMDRGRIVESGTHAQLLRQNGIYKKLWGMQTGGFIV